MRSFINLLGFAVEEMLSLGHTVSLIASSSESIGSYGCQCGHANAGKRSLLDPIVSTNFLMFIPAALYYSFECYLAAVSVLVSIFLSLQYHIHSEVGPVRLALDQLGGIVAFFITVTTAFLGRETWPSLDTFVIAVGLMSLAFWCKKQQEVKSYDTYHTLWHLSIFLGQMQLNYILRI